MSVNLQPLSGNAPGKLPNSGNFAKNKPKLYKFEFYARNRGIFRNLYGAGELKYATWIFEGAKGVAMYQN